jgi:hypothetical protein
VKIVALVLFSLSAAGTMAFAEPSAAPAAPAAPAVQVAKETAPAAPAKDAPPSAQSVHYAKDKITLDVKNMPAADLIDEIARQANAKVTGSVGDAAPVTATWTDLPLKDALEHTLGAQNFTLTYSEQGELRAIQLKGQQQQQQQQQQGGMPFEYGPDARPDDKTRSAASETALFKAFDLRDQLPIDGAISRRLGRDKAPLDLIANTTIADSDPNVRKTGMKAMMKMFEGNQALRDQVMATTNGMTDAQLAAFARAYMYHWAEDFVHNIKRDSSDPEVRRRAGSVLRELRKNPYTGPIPLEGSQPLPPA